MSRVSEIKVSASSAGCPNRLFRRCAGQTPKRPPRNPAAMAPRGAITVFVPEIGNLKGAGSPRGGRPCFESRSAAHQGGSGVAGCTHFTNGRGGAAWLPRRPRMVGSVPLRLPGLPVGRGSWFEGTQRPWRPGVVRWACRKARKGAATRAVRPAPPGGGTTRQTRLRWCRRRDNRRRDPGRWEMLHRGRQVLKRWRG